MHDLCVRDCKRSNWFERHEEAIHDLGIVEKPFVRIPNLSLDLPLIAIRRRKARWSYATIYESFINIGF